MFKIINPMTSRQIKSKKKNKNKKYTIINGGKKHIEIYPSNREKQTSGNEQ